VEPVSNRRSSGGARRRQPRRRVLWLVLVIGVALFLSAAALSWQAGKPDAPAIEGRVVGAAGQPVADATVRTPDGRQATTDRSGGFGLDGAPTWVTVNARGWISRTRMVTTGSDNLVRLAQNRPGTVTLAFGGDVMFGRRYFDTEDTGSMVGQLDPDDGAAAHARLLDGVAPMLADADLTAVNLETPLVEDPAYDPTQPRPRSFHPTKDFAFASSPAAAVALRRVGVDVVDIGNNHLFDRLQAGVVDTRRYLTAAGLAPGRGSFGAGGNADEAWAPAFRTARGQRVAFLGCTSIPGDDQPITYVATKNKGGAARCAPERLRTAVQAAQRRADIVVVMVHGGYEYGRDPSIQVRALTDVAVAAGATMVINHHPHVVGGLRFANGQLTAWTLGNLLFDQTVWPTFESYLLKVAVRDARVVSAWLEPVQIRRYRPAGVHGQQADWVARGALARSEGPWVAEHGSMWLDAAGAASPITAPLPPGRLVRLTSGCAPAAGRELLWTGDFEPSTWPEQPPAGLWNIARRDPYRRLDPDAAHDSRQGVLLTRADPHSADVLLNPRHRVLVDAGDRLTLLVDHQALFGRPEAAVQLSWYNDTRGGSQQRTTVRLPTGTDWTTARIDVTAPKRTVAVQPFVRLHPPTDGVSQIAVDNLRLVNWDQPGCDYVEVGGTAQRAGLAPTADGPTTAPVVAQDLPVAAVPSLPPPALHVTDR
jgi:poly-gamma-glutamate synthesis protein (capsule biosynthesis protein)